MQPTDFNLCRILAIFPNDGHPFDPSIVVSFRNLAACGMVPPRSKPGHCDGWGMVTWIDGTPVYLGREPRDALKDKKYDLACEKMKELKADSPLLLHLRKASVGLKVQENTHPFVINEWAFAHNGTIRKLGLRSTTDSQWFFEALMRDYERTSNMIESIRARIQAVHDAYPYTSITFILSNGKELYAYRDCTKNYEYYGMYYAQTDGAIVVCQEKLFDADWNALDNGELLRIDSERRYSVLQISRPIAPHLSVSKT